MAVDDFVTYNVFENIDKLVTLDIKAQGVIPCLYEAARRVSGAPLVLEAAKALVDRGVAGTCALICTGFVCPPDGLAETDGVIGSVVLARALEVGMNVRPIIICEAEIVPPLKEMITKAGLHAYINCEEVSQAAHSVTICSFTTNAKEAEKQANEILKEFSPVAAISIERPGKNDRGVYHMGNGTDVSEYAAKVDVLFEHKGENVLTIGIGDLGNELGLGSIKETVRSSVLYGSECQCPCKGGIASSVEADKIIIASSSDWGAYALAAGISYLTNKTEAFIDSTLEKELLQTGVQNGLVDGPTRYHVPHIDGMATGIHLHIVDLLGEITRYGRVFHSRFPQQYELYAQLHGTKMKHL